MSLQSLPAYFKRRCACQNICDYSSRYARTVIEILSHVNFTTKKQLLDCVLASNTISNISFETQNIHMSMPSITDMPTWARFGGFHGRLAVPLYHLCWSFAFLIAFISFKVTFTSTRCAAAAALFKKPVESSAAVYPLHQLIMLSISHSCQCSFKSPARPSEWCSRV